MRHTLIIYVNQLLMISELFVNMGRAMTLIQTHVLGKYDALTTEPTMN